MSPILVNALWIGLIGLVCGVSLALAARFMAVHEDPKIGEVEESLPGANCGGCGYAGCADYAKAIVTAGAPITLCAPGGQGTIDVLGDLMGVKAEAAERKVAIVLCGGDSEMAPRGAQYNGIADCRAAHNTGGGDKLCVYGCLGYGSCANVCPVDAIEITDKHLAVVHPDLCIGCGKCVEVCPRNIIKLVPESRHIHVLCSNRDKGPQVKKVCKVGCIGCTVCTKLAEDNAIVMEGFLAVVDYSKPLENEVVAPKCPGKCIVDKK
jgi:electron transport complex protein RnfB